MPLKTATLYRLLCMLSALGFAVSCFAQQTPTDLDKYFTADVLKVTLFPRTIEEMWFCDYVIQKRDDGTIPPQLIYGVYRKAMLQDRGRRFAYFRAALEIMCMREGIILYPAPATAPSSQPSQPFSLSRNIAAVLSFFNLR